uniref:collagen alpha-1(XIV) chain-like n=1 Tax=Solea senegalensis TaxID=28829 RepID=UPI001CD834D9|nr:collagen alpha-1(XIV) chain-like [Solea senegalensis]
MKSRFPLVASLPLLLLLMMMMMMMFSSTQAREQGAPCNTPAKADIVVLVDGSWSIGRINFKLIRSFISRMVSVFDIGPDRVQIGLTQYTGDPKTEWHLNAHPTKESLQEAISNLPYKGGNTMTGMALTYILNINFKAEVGMRPDSRKIGVLITDGKSQDEVLVSSQSLRDSGIELYAIGVKNADEIELRSIASDPHESHVYSVRDFMFLVDNVDDLSSNLCNSVKGPELLKSMEVYDEGVSTMWVRWEKVPRATGYMLLYRPISAIESQLVYELRVGGNIKSVQLEQLIPNTVYDITLHALFREAQEGRGVTLPRPPAGVLTITDVTHSTMTLRWDAAPGAVRKYMITYQPEGGDLSEVQVSGDITSLHLSSLISMTEYKVTVTPVYDEGPGSPMLNTIITSIAEESL